jgi:hypothetical protein
MDLEMSESNLQNLIQKTHLFFAVPCYGGQVTEPFFTSFLKLQLAAGQLGLKYSIRTIVNDSLVTRARNTLVAHFLANTEATHLMFIDADIRFQPEDVIRLLQHQKPVIGGSYPKKTIDWASIKQHAAQLSAEHLKFAGSEYALNPVAGQSQETNPLEVKDLATGFLMIERSVITQLCEANPQLKYKNTMVPDPSYKDLFYALFDTSIDEDDKVYLSEDYTFCRRWQKIGGKIFCDRSIALDHVGHYTFTGRPLLN